MKTLKFLAAVGALTLGSCSIHGDVWERERTPLTTLSPSAEAAVASATSALIKDTGAAAVCYVHEVEAAGDDFIVSFFSPPAVVSPTAQEVVVHSGSGSCGQGRVYAVSRSGIVLGSRFGR